ncbi:MAG: TatD family hydrolase [bacterium]|nr:TatD family hydrolase [bacterium]
MIFESHAHYDDERFAEDRGELLTQLPTLGIKRIINVASTIESIDVCVKLSKEYPHVYASVGVHPSELEGMTDDVIDHMKQLTADEKVVAIGEIGLDFYWEKDEEAQNNQKDWFIKQLALARAVDLPVIIHSRDAAEETMRIMKEHATGLDAVIHCYSYSPELAREYVKMGYYLGIGGVVTFKNAKKLVTTVEQTPLNRILLETDSPYLTPEPFRGERNDSGKLFYVVEKIAQIKGLSTQEVEEVTWNNACALFRMNR